MRATILTLLILAVPSLCAAGPTVGDLAWMAGSWRSEDGGGAVSEEIWSAPGGGIMLGMHRDVTAKRTSSSPASGPETENLSGGAQAPG